MKHSIEGFNQEYTISLSQNYKLDCTDLVILRWFVDFYPNMRKENFDGKEFAWVSYGKVLEDLPILGITKRALAKRFEKMVKLEILNFRFLKQNGNYTFYSFGENYFPLVSSKGCTSNDKGVVPQTTTDCTSNNKGLHFKQQRGCTSNNKGVALQTTNKDKSIIYKSIKDNSINIASNDSDWIESF